MEIKRYLSRRFLPVLSGMMFLGMLSGCSDNIAEGLYPAEEAVRELQLVDSPVDGKPLGSEIRLSSANGQRVVTVISDTRWEAEILECEGSWCSISGAVGKGNGQFTILPVDNPTGAGRECLLNVFVIDRDGERLPYESVTLRLIQEGRELNVSPLNPAPVGYLGVEGMEFSVVTNQAWILNCNQWVAEENPGGFISIADAGGLDRKGDEWHGSGSLKFKLNVERNLMRNERVARLTITSPTDAFLPINIDLEQEGAVSSFSVSGPPIVEGSAGEANFRLYSPTEDWTILSTCDWLVFDNESGAASDEVQIIKARVLENTLGSARSGEVTFRGNDTGVERTLSITQSAMGGSVGPTLSSPWVTDGWTQSEAEICCAYLSPDYEITAGGVSISLDGEHWTDFESEITDPHGGEIRYLIGGLTGATDYRFRCWVRYQQEEEETVRYSRTQTFRTAGAYPGNGDNNNPKN